MGRWVARFYVLVFQDSLIPIFRGRRIFEETCFCYERIGMDQPMVNGVPIVLPRALLGS